MASGSDDMDIILTSLATVCSAVQFMADSRKIGPTLQIFGNLLSVDSPVEVISSFVSSTSRASEEHCTRTRIQDYVCNIVPLYNDQEFVSHFRMSRVAYENLRGIIGPELLFVGGRVVPLDNKLLMTIWTLANEDSFRAVGDRFGVHKSTAHFVFTSVCSAIAKNSCKFIKWPTKTEQATIESHFSKHEGFPGIIGAVDGCHIPIEAPEGSDREAYYNRKKFFSVLLQGTCDNKKKFIDVDIGQPGSSHDAHVYQMSPLGQNLSKLLPPEYHLLGDSAYPLQLNLLTPHRDNGHLTPAEVHFNRIHSGRRSVIENAYGFLKTKWRRLKYLNMSNLEILPLVILTACCLHNHILDNDYFDDFPVDDDQVDIEDYVNSKESTTEQEMAENKRINIQTLLFN